MRAHEARATVELATSKRLLAEDRRRLVYPLATEHQRNRFSDMIRDALEAGYDDIPPSQEHPRPERRK